MPSKKSGELSDSQKEIIRKMYIKGYTITDIVEFFKKTYPKTKIYYNKVSRELEKFVEEECLYKQSFNDISKELDRLNEFVVYDCDLQRNKKRTITRKIKLVNEAIKKTLINQSQREEEMMNESRDTITGFSRELQSLYPKYKGLREDVLELLKNYIKEKRGYY
jgi:hypothetical protein